MRTPVYHNAIVDVCDKKHVTVDEIFEAVKKTHPKVGYSTVYRNVEELVMNGRLKKINGIGSKALFEKAGYDHCVHFVDTMTGQIIDITIPLQSIAPMLPTGYVVESADIRLYGSVHKAASERL